VYQNIGASYGMIDETRNEINPTLLATTEEVETSRSLLENGSRCFSKTFVENVNEHETTLRRYRDRNENNCTAVRAAFTLLSDGTSPAPAPTGTLGLKVRKIRFSGSTLTEIIPIPDPALLLGKAVSNWLRRHGCHALPVCDENYEDQSVSCYSNNSRNVPIGTFVETSPTDAETVSLYDIDDE
jgi:hypothetical protein